MFMLVFVSSLLFGGRPLPLVHAFSSSPLSLPNKVDPNKIIGRTVVHPSFAELVVVAPLWILYAVPANDDNGDDDDDDDEDEALLDDSALGDWRKFRASLIDAGLPTISSTGTSSDASDSASSSTSPATEETTQQQPNTAPAAAAASETRRRKSVAAQNEALLEQQSQALAQEYRTSVWAHIIEEPEVGGLLCRMPLEAELYHGSTTTSTSSSTSSSSSVSSSSTRSTTGSDGGSYWKDKLRLMVSLENDKGNITTATTSALLAASSTKQPLDDNDTSDEAATAAKVKHWFAAAERMVNQELKSITENAKIQNGILNPNDLNPHERLLLDKYLGYKQTWQEISLVLLHNPQAGFSESVIINRPISTNLNKAFATVLVEGPNGRGKGSFSYDFIDDMVRAFGKQAAIYMGGPDLQEEPALLLHGIANLRGATEVAPGTGIYQGGLQAAVEGINQGLYQPLDFRFFIGRQMYNPSQNAKGRGNLLQKVRQGQYRPVACARSLALKQCLGLPKPLWHEVLELCGGEMKALSSIELRKRLDLQQ